MNGAETRIIAAAQIQAEAEILLRDRGRMQMAYAFATAEGVALRYLTAPKAGHPFVLWCVPPGESPLSLAKTWPLLGWYEREMMDLYGLRFAGHPEPVALLPLRPDNGIGGQNNHPAPPIPSVDRPLTPEVEAGAVQQLPFGPVRADVHVRLCR